MQKWKNIGLTLVLLLSMVLTACGGTNQGKAGDQSPPEGQPAEAAGKGTVTIGVTPWTSTVPPTQVARLILEKMGYTVKLQKADVGVVYTGLAKGDIDVFMDSWLPDMHKNYMEKYGKDIDDTAVSYPNGELGWVVPTYVKDIQSITDLKGKEALFGNKIYGIEEGAGMTLTSKKMIKDYGLDLQYVASSEAGMLSQVKRETAQKKPILFLGWRPHPMFVNWDLRVLKDPKGFFKTQEVHVLTHKGFKDEAPEAYAFLKKWSIPVEDVEKMIVKIDSGTDPTEVAKEWIQNNPDKVKKMTEK